MMLLLDECDEFSILQEVNGSKLLCCYYITYGHIFYPQFCGKAQALSESTGNFNLVCRGNFFTQMVCTLLMSSTFTDNVIPSGFAEKTFA